MTNLEWIKSLTLEQMADFIIYIDDRGVYRNKLDSFISDCHEYQYDRCLKLLQEQRNDSKRAK